METLKWMNNLPEGAYTTLEIVSNLIGIATLILGAWILVKMFAEGLPLSIQNDERVLNNLKGQVLRRFTGYRDLIALLVLSGVLGTVSGAVPFVYKLGVALKAAKMTLPLSALAAAFGTSFLGIGCAIVATVVFIVKKNRLLDRLDKQLLELFDADGGITQKEKDFAKIIGQETASALEAGVTGQMIQRIVDGELQRRGVDPSQTQSY